MNFEPGVRTDDPKDPLLPGPGRRIRTSEFIRVANIIRSLYGEKFPTITETILGKDLATHRRLIYQETPTRLSARRQPANRKLTELYPEERKLLLKLKVFTELDFLNADQLAVNTLTKREPSKRVAYTRFACPHCKDALAVENPLFGCGHIYTADDPMLCGGDKDLPPSIKRHVEKSCASPTTGDQEDVAEVLTQLVALKAHVDSRFDSLEAGQRESFVKLARMIRSRFPDHPTVVESVDEFIDMVLGDGG